MAQTSVIADRSRRRNGWAAIIFGTVFGGFATVFMVFALWATIDSPNPITPFMLVCGGLFMLLGGAMVAYGIRSVWLGHLFGVPTLTIRPGRNCV